MSYKASKLSDNGIFNQIDDVNGALIKQGKINNMDHKLTMIINQLIDIVLASCTHETIATYVSR